MRSQFDRTSRVITQLDKLQETAKVNSVASMASCDSEIDAQAEVKSAQSIAAQQSQAMGHVVLPSKLLQQMHRSMLQNTMQVRGFKTHRSIESQLKRDPSISDRLHNLMSECCDCLLT